MIRLQHFTLVLLMISMNIGCKSNEKDKTASKTITIDSTLQIRYQKLLDYPLDSLAFPRSYTPSTNTIHKVPSKDWTSGFFQETYGNCFN